MKKWERNMSLRKRNIKKEIEEIWKMIFKKVRGNEIVGGKGVEEEDLEVGIGLVRGRVEIKVRERIEVKVIGIIEMSGERMRKENIEWKWGRIKREDIRIIRKKEGKRSSVIKVGEGKWLLS